MKFVYYYDTKDNLFLSNIFKNPNRNGLGDDSYFTWPDGRIPFVIGDGFNSTNKQNILDAVDYYNDIFGDCIKWIPKSDEVRTE